MTERLRPHQIEELLGAYALDAVDPDEREQVELALRDHPEWRDEVAGHLEVAALLAHSGAPAPDGLWGRIADALEEPPPAMRLAVVPTEAPHPTSVVAPTPAVPTREVTTDPVVSLDAERARRRARAGMVLGAVAATIILFLGIVVVRQEQRLDRQEQELVTPSVDELAAEALADPDSREAVLESEDGALAAKAVVLPDGTGYLLGDELPELAADRTYQLWGVTEGGTVVSLGVFGAEPGTATFQVDGEVTTFALTEEVEGGVVASTNTPVVAGELA